MQSNDDNATLPEGLAKNASLRRLIKPGLALLLIIVSVAGVYAVYNNHPQRTVPFHTILWGQANSFGEASIVVNDNTTWLKTWKQAFCSGNPCPPLPQVDFATRTVLAAFSGIVPTAGYEMNFTQVIQIGPRDLAQVSFSTSGNCQVAQIYGLAPYHIVD